MNSFFVDDWLEDLDGVDGFDAGFEVDAVEEVPGCIGCWLELDSWYWVCGHTFVPKYLLCVPFVDEFLWVFEDLGVPSVEVDFVADGYVGASFGVFAFCKAGACDHFSFETDPDFGFYWLSAGSAASSSSVFLLSEDSKVHGPPP